MLEVPHPGSDGKIARTVYGLYLNVELSTSGTDEGRARRIQPLRGYAENVRLTRGCNPERLNKQCTKSWSAEGWTSAERED
jgi:hypothetical protein